MTIKEDVLERIKIAQQETQGLRTWLDSEFQNDSNLKDNQKKALVSIRYALSSAKELIEYEVKNR